jgi:hypothetical protein
MIKKLVIFIIILTFFSHIFARKLKYKEEFYRLHYLPQMYNNNDLGRNLFWLEIADYAAFSPPIQALVVTKTEKQYKKYKLLLKMHIAYLKARNKLFFAARYDKHEPVFFNKPYSDLILDSLTYAKYYYESAADDWEKVIEYIEKLAKYDKEYVELGFIEDIRYRVTTGDLDLNRVINRKLKKLEITTAYFKESKDK